MPATRKRKSTSHLNTSEFGRDCRNCNRRRIRCDRGEPACQKCLKKAIVCSGYGLHIRWKAPVSTQSHNETVSHAGADKELHADLPGITNQSNYCEPGDPDGIGTLPPGNAVSLTVASDTPDDAPTLSEVESNLLLTYYSERIAPMMVWFDSKKNLYKTLPFTLAATSRVLRLAMVAISAAHMGPDAPVDSNFATEISNYALKMITKHVRAVLGSESENSDESHEAVLASALVLSNHSLLGSQIDLAQVHLYAVRNLIEYITAAGGEHSELFIFLQDQAAPSDILLCTTSFDKTQIHNALPINRDIDNFIFRRYLVVVHNITKLSITEDWVGQQEIARLETIADFEDRFDGATSSSLLAAATTFPERSQQDKEDFIRMLHTFNHAGVLYACHRLSCVHTGHFVAYHSRRLFRLLRTAEEQRSPLINYAWPIFIAGLCSWPDLERIDVVRKLCRRLSEETRFACYESISAFHQALWDSEHRDWIRLAKEWRERGQQIIAI